MNLELIDGLVGKFRVRGWPRTRAGRLSEFVLALELALDGAQSFDGHFYGFAEASWSPCPVQHPRPPIAIRAVGPRVLRLTAKLADVGRAFGWHRPRSPKKDSSPRSSACHGGDAGRLKCRTRMVLGFREALRRPAPIARLPRAITGLAAPLRGSQCASPVVWTSLMSRPKQIDLGSVSYGGRQGILV
jgi:hypothetical protein